MLISRIFLFLSLLIILFFFFFFNDTATTEIYTLSLHDALPSWPRARGRSPASSGTATACSASCACTRSEEHTSELQSPCNLVCRLLLEKKKKTKSINKDKTKNTTIT